MDVTTINVLTSTFFYHFVHNFRYCCPLQSPAIIPSFETCPAPICVRMGLLFSSCGRVVVVRPNLCIHSLTIHLCPISTVPFPGPRCGYLWLVAVAVQAIFNSTPIICSLFDCCAVSNALEMSFYTRNPGTPPPQPLCSSPPSAVCLTIIASGKKPDYLQPEPPNDCTEFITGGRRSAIISSSIP